MKYEPSEYPLGIHIVSVVRVENGDRMK